MKNRSVIPGVLVAFAVTIAASPAAILYSGLRNISVTNSFTSVYLDVDAITVSASEVPGWDIDAFFGGEAFGNSADFQPVRQSVANNSAIVRLYFGDIVDATDIFATTAAGSSTHIGNAADQFASGAEGYLGFSLIDNSDAGPYYGWMRVNFSNSGGTGTLIDWAYDNSGAPITVGVVPEPASITLLGLGAVALVLRRRKS